MNAYPYWMRPADTQTQVCQICLLEPEFCECPECEVCGEVGNPRCLDHHNLLAQMKREVLVNSQ